ncbi:hypothetical protein CDO73_21435 [Saccharibacillus sp. O23]|nr:hypothetical protein CDO73_21435 [Saccharibacillus sp. O23]
MTVPVRPLQDKVEKLRLRAAVRRIAEPNRLFSSDSQPGGAASANPRPARSRTARNGTQIR